MHGRPGMVPKPATKSSTGAAIINPSIRLSMDRINYLSYIMIHVRVRFKSLDPRLYALPRDQVLITSNKYSNMRIDGSRFAVGTGLGWRVDAAREAREQRSHQASWYETIFPSTLSKEAFVIAFQSHPLQRSFPSGRNPAAWTTQRCCCSREARPRASKYTPQADTGLECHK